MGNLLLYIIQKPKTKKKQDKAVRDGYHDKKKVHGTGCAFVVNHDENRDTVGEKGTRRSEAGHPNILQPPPERQGLHLGGCVEVGFAHVVAPVGCLQQPLEVVPLRPVLQLMADLGLGLHFLVVTSDETDWNCNQSVFRVTMEPRANKSDGTTDLQGHSSMSRPVPGQSRNRPSF